MGRAGIVGGGFGVHSKCAASPVVVAMASLAASPGWIGRRRHVARGGWGTGIDCAGLCVGTSGSGYLVPSYRIVVSALSACNGVGGRRFGDRFFVHLSSAPKVGRAGEI